MNKFALLLTVLLSTSAFAATPANAFKFKTSETSAPVLTAQNSTTDAWANYTPATVANDDVHVIVVTNVDQLAKSTANVSANVMMNNHAGVALGYSSGSNKEKREKLNNQELTVDRTVTTLGAAFYVWEVEARKNISIVPSVIFRSEKDAINTENENGLGIKTVGVFRPTRVMLLEGGVNTTVIAGETTGQAHLGLGFFF